MTKAARDSVDLPSSLMLGSHALRIEYTASVRQVLTALDRTLEIEMELYFSCLIRKQVHFRDHSSNKVHVRAALAPGVSVSFRPVMTQACVVGDIDRDPEVELFPLVRESAFVPKWLRLDYRQGGWFGEFGYV